MQWFFIFFVSIILSILKVEASCGLRCWLHDLVIRIPPLDYNNNSVIASITNFECSKLFLEKKNNSFLEFFFLSFSFTFPISNSSFHSNINSIIIIANITLGSIESNFNAPQTLFAGVENVGLDCTSDFNLTVGILPSAHGSALVNKISFFQLKY